MEVSVSSRSPSEMPCVTWAAIATTTAMGQQVYEHEMRNAVSEIAGDELQFIDVRVSSLRSRIPCARRSPVGVLQRVPLSAARLMGAAVYRSTGLVHRLDLRLPPALGREVLTVHDLPPLRFPDEGRLPASAAEGARRAKVVICPSTFAAAEVKDLLDVTRIEVIPYGLSRSYSDVIPADDANLRSRGISGPFVLHAAGATARKNLRELARAWANVSRGAEHLQLVLCGPRDSRRDHAFEGLDRVVMTGRLPPEAVASLMARASAVVVPSVYEGFGLPALEAMACGAPVVAARRGALPEVCGDAALLVEPEATALAKGLTQLLHDRRLTEELRSLGRVRAAQFEWSAAARSHVDVYRAVLSAR
jgi:glycosyltransferase involved in cell wall biosynthesis